MRTAGQDLINELLSASEFICCDLYKLFLSDGTTYYIADYDKDISYNSNKYLCDLFLMKRDSIKLSGQPTVDSLSVTIYADNSHSDLIKNTYIMKALHDGLFDGAMLSLSRCYIGSQGQIVGVMGLFTGRCEINSANAFTCKLTVKSETTGLAGLIPLRVFAAQNAYSENSSGSVITASTDDYTCAIPLKPSQNVLVKL